MKFPLVTWYCLELERGPLESGGEHGYAIWGQADVSAVIIPVIFARLDSRRLPGKVLEPLLDGKCIIDELLVQLGMLAKQVPCVAEPVIATTSRTVDEPVVHRARLKGITAITDHFAPLKRLRVIAATNPHCWLWRVNADSPLLLQPLIEYAAAQLSIVDDQVQVITNLVDRSFPYGVSLEMFRAAMINAINMDQATQEQLEHITPVTQQLLPSAIRGVTANDLGLSRFDPSVRLTIDDVTDAGFFRALWADPDFQRTRPGSVERVDYAYKRRLSGAT